MKYFILFPTVAMVTEIAIIPPFLQQPLLRRQIRSTHHQYHSVYGNQTW